MTTWIIVVAVLLGWGFEVEAITQCVTMDVSTWTQAQKNKLEASIVRLAHQKGYRLTELDGTPTYTVNDQTGEVCLTNPLFDHASVLSSAAILQTQQLPDPPSEDQPIEIPIEDFGAGVAGALAVLGGRGLVVMARKRRQPSA